MAKQTPSADTDFNGVDMTDPANIARAKRLNKGLAQRLAQPWNAQDTRRLQYHPTAFGAPRFGVNSIRNREADRRDAEIMLSLSSERSNAPRRGSRIMARRRATGRWDAL